MSEESKKIIEKQKNNKTLFDPIKNKTMLFFFITPLGLEDINRSDVTDVLSFHKRDFKLLESTKGGFEIEMSFSDLFDLIPYMKGLTRILMRLGNDHDPKLYKTIVRDYPKLFQKITKYPWEHFLFGEIPNIEISTKNSRLFDSRKIEKSITEGIERHYQMKPVKALYLAKKETTTANTLFVRIINDQLTISIDLVGDRLDQRHEKLLSSKAPLRESIAYALAKKSFSLIPKDLMPISLIDPFVGSGTMIKECLEINAPTLKRFRNEDYAYFHFPSFDKWKKSPAYKEFKQRTDDHLSADYQNINIENFFASDLDTEMLVTAQKNLKSTLITHKSNASFKQLDATQFNQDNIGPSFLFTNPPYGERIELKNAMGETLSPDTFLSNLLSDFKKAKINYVGFISTPEQTSKIKNTKERTIIFRRLFKNGGIDVEYVFLKNHF